jgi:hypothetical protein
MTGFVGLLVCWLVAYDLNYGRPDFCSDHRPGRKTYAIMPRFNWLTLFVVLALFGAAWLPRTLALDRFVTADERLWLARSANFYLALAERNAADTFQREHPGVTVMWAGALGFLNEFPTYPQVTPGPFDWESEALESWLYSATTHTPLELLAAGRWWIALAIALAITAGYFPLHRLLGGAAALVATLFVAWDPFFIALSRELHPDGLVAALMLLALLYWLAWLYAGQRWRDLVAAGILMGLAWLTKTPAIFLVLTGAILVAIELLRRKDSIATPPIVGLLGWGLVATLTFVALWPAMWVDPLGTLAEMAREMSSYLEGHVNPNFFWGATTADPGPWFYPVSYWFRTTPAVLIGLLATAIVFWPRVAPFDRRSARQTALALVLFALIFTIGMTLGSKKFDRYLLPIFPALSILAAVGWLSISQWIIGFWTHWRTSSPHPLILALPVLAVLLLHGLLGFSHYPYYLTYYNPLAGGGAVAQRVIMVGWGEGMDQAAAWLNQQPDGATARVVAWYGDGPLSYFLRSREPVFSFWSPEYWLAADYAVVYLSQRQRLIPDRAVIDYFAGLPAAHVVVVDGLELARIYDLRGRPPPDFVGLATDSAGALGCCLRLAGYAVGQHNFLSGDQVIVRLFLDGDDALATGAVSTLHLFAPDGSALNSGRTISMCSTTKSACRRTPQPDNIQSR